MDWQEIIAWLLASLLLLPVSLVLRADVPPEADRYITLFRLGHPWDTRTS